MSIEQSAATGPGQGALARGELWLLAGFIVVTLNLRIAFAGLGPILGPDAFSLETAARVHRPDYLDFLARAHDLWRARGNRRWVGIV